MNGVLHSKFGPKIRSDATKIRRQSDAGQRQEIPPVGSYDLDYINLGAEWDVVIRN